MKKMIAIFIFTLMLWKIIGFTVYFNIEKLKIQQEVNNLTDQNLSVNKLTVLSFSLKQTKQLIWINKDEFKYQGRMYDIVKRSKSDCGYTFHCFNDQKEASLFVKLTQFTSNDLGHQSDESPINELLKSLQFPFLLVSQNIYFLAIALINEEHVFLYQNLHKDWSNQIVPPPPQG